MQGAANAYHIETLPRFTHWFDSVEVLDERECFDISCEIEPNSSGSKASQKSEQVTISKRFICPCLSAKAKGQKMDFASNLLDCNMGKIHNEIVFVILACIKLI